MGTIRSFKPVTLRPRLSTGMPCFSVKGGNAISETSTASYIPPSRRSIKQPITNKQATTDVANRRQRKKLEIVEEAYEERSRLPATHTQQIAKNGAKKVVGSWRQEVLLFDFQPPDRLTEKNFFVSGRRPLIRTHEMA